MNMDYRKKKKRIINPTEKLWKKKYKPVPSWDYQTTIR